jgi:hypothetical protein
MNRLGPAGTLAALAASNPAHGHAPVVAEHAHHDIVDTLADHDSRISELEGAAPPQPDGESS